TVLRHRLNEATASVVSGRVRTLHQLTQCIRIWQARGLVDVLLRNDVLTSVNNTGRFVLSTPTRVPARGEHPRVRRTTRTAHVVLVVIPDDLVAGGIRNVGTGCVSVQVPESVVYIIYDPANMTAAVLLNTGKGTARDTAKRSSREISVVPDAVRALLLDIGQVPVGDSRNAIP